MRWLAATTLALGCGGSGTKNTIPSDLLDKKTPPSTDGGAAMTPAPAPPEPPPALKTLTATQACTRFEALAQQGCSWTQRLPPEFRQGNNCVTNVESWLASSNPTHAQMQHVVDCWALECDEATNCIVYTQQHAPPPPPRACGEEGTSPILVDAAAWDARRGKGARRFADVKTSQTEPVELCEIGDEVEWMSSVVCNDGSNPYGSPAVANERRDGWLGRGGKCNSILDRYSVPCPEATYTIYIDRYVCQKK